MVFIVSNKLGKSSCPPTNMARGGICWAKEEITLEISYKGMSNGKNASASLSTFAMKKLDSSIFNTLTDTFCLLKSCKLIVLCCSWGEHMRSIIKRH